MAKTKNKYFVLLTDLVGSQAIEDREIGTIKLKKAIHDFNTLFGNSTLAPMEITRGDEAAAVLKRIDSLYEMLSKFAANLRPFTCRFVVTYGSLTAGLSSKRSTEMDGPAFYQADVTMKELKKTRKTFLITTGNAVLDSAITSLVNLTLHREQELTSFQFQVVQLYAKGLKQEEIARTVKRTQQQVSQVVGVVPFELLEDAWKSIRLLSQELQHKSRGGRFHE